MRCRSLLQRRIFTATNLQPLYDLCKFSAKNIATIFILDSESFRGVSHE
jgi:hypothetical protein